MDELKKQVARAHRRLTFQRFLRVLTWAMFGTFLVAAIAIAAPKIWAMEISNTLWTRGWLIGAAVAGLSIAGGWAFFNRRSPLEAAIEIDQRFGLKERVSSTFALSEAELESEAGRALIDDASRRVAKIDIGEKFKTQGSWSSLLPFLPAAAAFLLILLPNAKQAENAANALTLQNKVQIKRTTEELKKKWADQKKKLEEKDLEAAKLFNELEKGADNLSKMENADKKKAMIKLNDLAEKIKERRDQIGDAKKLQNQLNQLKSLKQGPGSEMAKAMSKGNFSKAADELAKMTEKLRSGKMNSKEREDMANNMQKMADKLQKMSDAHKQAKDELKKQIEQAKKAGDRAKAGELQRKMDKLNQQNKQMQKMQKMAQNMQKAAKNLKQAQQAQKGQKGQKGDQKGQQAQQAQKAAQQAMQQMAQDLQEMAEEMDEMEMLDEAMQQLADAKNQMNCKQCNGMGCEKCNGNGDGMGEGMGKGKGDKPGKGLGEGRGAGARPEDKDADGDFYETQVRAKVRRGKSVTTGMASGENLAGEALEEVREAIEAANNDSADPLTNVRLPKEYRDHVREYLDSVGGNNE